MHANRGALFIEATISLSIFIFMMYTLYSVVNIAVLQERIASAQDTATKQFAEYAHLYFLSDLAEINSGTGGKSSEMANTLANHEVIEFLEIMAAAAGGTELEEPINTVKGGIEAIEGDSITGILTNKAGAEIIKKLMEKNLVGKSGSMDDFYRRNHIKGQFDLSDSVIFIDGSGSAADRDVFVVCNYTVQMIQLMDINIEFNLSHASYTRAWGA